MNSEHVNGVMESDDILRRGQDLAQAIVAAAEEHVIRAQANLDRAKSVADIILAQTNDEVRRINTKTANDKAATEKLGSWSRPTLSWTTSQMLTGSWPT
jgi:hypothetical protein